MEKSDFIFYNVTDGLKAMDKIRLKIYDPKMPINIENVTVRLDSNILLQSSIHGNIFFQCSKC